MSQPRQIVAGATYFITRRILRRHHLLRPDSEINELVVYALGVCSARYGVHVHAHLAMSTHIHLLVTDVSGTLPLFLAQFHRVIAMVTKVVRQWEGAVWDHEPTSVVRLTTDEAIVDKIAYLIANPVAAGLVRYARDWPGAKTRTSELGGGVQSARRPTAWLDPESWPDHARLELVAPPAVAVHEIDSWRERVAEAVRDHEHRAWVHWSAERRGFLGAERIAAVSPYRRATSVEEVRRRNPTFASGGVRDAYLAAVAALRAFRESYRIAFASWRAGVRDVVFPVGTWWMARVHSVVVAS